MNLARCKLLCGCCLCYLRSSVSLKFFLFPFFPVLVLGVASCGPLLLPWPIRSCGYTVLWLWCPCCMAVVGSHFFFRHRFGLSFLCSGFWTLRAGLIIWHVCHSLYAFILDVWCCRHLYRLLSLLLSVILCLLWPLLFLTASLMFLPFQPCVMIESWPICACILP